MRQRLAPSANRIASSFLRPLARARIRLATFAQAISSTSPASDMNTQTALDMNEPKPGSGRALNSGITSSDVSLWLSGYSCARRRSVGCAAASACVGVTPGCSLPRTRRKVAHAYRDHSPGRANPLW